MIEKPFCLCREMDGVVAIERYGSLSDEVVIKKDSRNNLAALKEKKKWNSLLQTLKVSMLSILNKIADKRTLSINCSIFLHCVVGGNICITTHCDKFKSNF